MTATLVTFGHGNAGQEELERLLQGACITQVVDVRRFPGSRRHPHTGHDELTTWLPAAGISYRWEPRLGGRRRLAAEDVDADPWWHVAAFRAYAAHTRTDEFRAGMADLLGDVRQRPPSSVAVMCSESLWWRCHRRLVGDVAVLLHGIEVRHLGHDGRTTVHVPADGARATPDGLRYDR